MEPRTDTVFPAARSELIFGLFALLCGMGLCNFVFFGGLNLGFSIAMIAALLCAAIYLRCQGCAFSPYAVALLSLCLIISAGFARSDDGFVKFVMLCFLALGSNLALTLVSGQNLRSPNGLSSVLDSFRGFFTMGFNGMTPACRGLKQSLRGGSPVLKKSGSILLGLAICVPVLAVMIPLLISADAAFSGIMALLPQFDLGELILTVLFGLPTALFLYSQATALRHSCPSQGAYREIELSVSHLTVNTVLGGICAVFSVYLFSQLAYFGGGFSGILPEEFTMAEYARRGFFEMAWLCAIDLGIIAAAAAFVRHKEGKMPLSTRLLCLFIGVVTLFFVVSASAKMFMYIDSYGLTRLRVLTEVIMVFLGIATATVSIWLFVPKLPYFKVILLVALVMGTAVLWADVDTVVANYNVSAYQNGQLKTVDVEYLASLGDGAKPHIARLKDDPDPSVSNAAKKYLTCYSAQHSFDFCSWNYASHAATAFYTQPPTQLSKTNS